MLDLKLVWCVRLNCTPVYIPRSQALAVYIRTSHGGTPRMRVCICDVIYAVNGNKCILQPLCNPYQARINEGMRPHITRCSYSLTCDLICDSNITVHRSNCSFT